MNRNPLRPVTDADIRAYEADGVVCLKGMFDREWTDRMREASIRFMESGAGRKRIVQRPGETARFYSNVFMCALDPNFMAFRNESPCGQIAAALMRVPRVRFWYDQIFIKEPALRRRRSGITTCPIGRSAASTSSRSGWRSRR